MATSGDAHCASQQGAPYYGNGDTVLYSNYDMLRETLEYDFEQEKKTDYSVLNADMAVKQICKFVTGIWQIHPFREGNTRTTAVFTMKWLQTFGFSVDNDVFKDNSWYTLGSEWPGPIRGFRSLGIE